jgi:hypothetical protein
MDGAVLAYHGQCTGFIHEIYLIPILNQSAIFVDFVISLLDVLVARLRRLFLVALIAPHKLPRGTSFHL